jgi:hypothetical protein
MPGEQNEMRLRSIFLSHVHYITYGAGSNSNPNVIHKHPEVPVSTAAARSTYHDDQLTAACQCHCSAMQALLLSKASK